MTDAEKFESFSVGVKPETNDLRREIFDAIAKVNGREDRMRNHCFVFERMVFGLHSLMLDAPDAFAGLFGDGDAVSKSRFLAWLREREGEVK
mgnify:CR=1 FL=1